MRLLWNSLLIPLGILLPTSTSVALAQSLSIAESATPATEQLLLTTNLPANVPPQMTFIAVEPTTVEEAAPVRPTTIVLPNVIQTPPTEPEVGTERDRVETIVIPEAPPTAGVETTENTQTPTPVPDSAGSDPADTEASTVEAPTEDPETSTETGVEDSIEADAPELSPEEIARQQKLIEADQLHLSGQIEAAEQLYREAKEPFDAEVQAQAQAPAMYDPTQLPPAGAVYWRQSEAGLAQQLETKTLVPLQFLVEQYPEFIPGHLRYAEALKIYEREEEARQVLEQATTLYPNEPELLKATITELGAAEQWLEASLLARQFALLNVQHPQAQEFQTLAAENLERYQSHLRGKLRGNAIANAITGALGFVLTGNLFGPISAIQTTTLMLRGETAVGESVANRAKEQLPMLEDEQVLGYVREVGNKLASVAGRDEFTYEFYVVMDDRLNAFALPGGKVFVNAGAILKTRSEAEFAGLLAHELSHAVLSHGFQLVTEGNFIANVTQFIPFGGTAANLIVLDYNRDMERQADALGTRILVSAGYAADGLHNLMMTLGEEEEDTPIFAWLSTHPDTDERLGNVESLIERNGYNRYTYEGVVRHLAIQERVTQLLEEFKAKAESEEE